MYCYVGGKGSGKTYSCMQNVIIPALKQGIPIRTNISLNTEKIYKDFIFADIEVIDDMSIDDILSTPNGYLLVIDEIQLIAGAGITYANIEKTYPGLLEFFSKSRHKVDKGRALNIVVISQTLEGIAKPVRMLLDVVYLCRKLNAFGMSKKYQIKQFEMVGGELAKTPLTKATGTYNKEVYQYYYSNSQNTSNETEVVQIQEKIVKEKTIFNNKLVKFMFLSPVIIGFLIYYLWDLYFSPYLGNETETKEQEIIDQPINKNNTNQPTETIIVKNQIPQNSYQAFQNKQKINDTLLLDFYGNPKFYLNGMYLDDEPYFMFNNDDGINVESISLTELKKLGFRVVKIHKELFTVNGVLVGYKKHNTNNYDEYGKFDSENRQFANNSLFKEVNSGFSYDANNQNNQNNLFKTGNNNQSLQNKNQFNNQNNFNQVPKFTQ